MSDSVKVIPMEQVEPIPLPGGSWSRMVLTQTTVPEIKSSLGYSIFKPGTETTSVSHEVEEVAFVLAGYGELRLEDGVAPFGPGQALFVPSHTWHAVANTGEQDVVMVFMFPYPNYPPTERR